MEINLISNTIPEKDSYANIWWPDEELKVLKNLQNYDGTTVFVDDCIPLVKSINSKKKVAWIIEPPVIKNHSYKYIEIDDLRNSFDLILTFDESLVQKYPDKVKLLPFGSCWISSYNCKLYEKKKLLSIVASRKNDAPGHKLRHSLISKLKNFEIDLYGTGYNEFPHTDDGRLMPFKDYMFSIVIENSKMNNYFTDKLIDCFAVGTIPIYWGAPNISQYFNESGMLSFDSMESCIEILKNLNISTYNNFKESMIINHELYKNWASPDKNLRLLLSKYL